MLKTSALEEHISNLDQKCVTLHNLAEALRAQVELVRTEGELKLREETQRRIDSSKGFQVVWCVQYTSFRIRIRRFLKQNVALLKI